MLPLFVCLYTCLLSFPSSSCVPFAYSWFAAFWVSLARSHFRIATDTIAKVLKWRDVVSNVIGMHFKRCNISCDDGNSYNRFILIKCNGFDWIHFRKRFKQFILISILDILWMFAHKKCLRNLIETTQKKTTNKCRKKSAYNPMAQAKTNYILATIAMAREKKKSDNKTCTIFWFNCISCKFYFLLNPTHWMRLAFICMLLLERSEKRAYEPHNWIESMFSMLCATSSFFFSFFLPHSLLLKFSWNVA